MTPGALSSSLMDENTINNSSTAPTLHLPAHEWSYRVPSPPRVIVPPPQINGQGLPDVGLGNGVPLDFESNGFANSEFLRTVIYAEDNVGGVDTMLNWKYEERRLAQKILPFLYLGPLAAARDANFLRQKGITMIMAVRNTQAARANLLSSKAALGEGIKTCAIDVAGNQELIAAFPKAIEAINTHLALIYKQQETKSAVSKSQGQPPAPTASGKVLVFCESGNERSAAVVVAYVMAMFSMDVIPVIQLVQAQRFCVSFDDPLRFLLQSYESILKAKRDVVKSRADWDASQLAVNWHQSSHPAQSVTTEGQPERASKRTLNQAYGDDMDVDSDDQHDDGRFERRGGSAPFADG